MSPIIPARGQKISTPDNIYTALLAAALLIVVATAGIITFLCHSQYQTIFKIVTPY